MTVTTLGGCFLAASQPATFVSGTTLIFHICGCIWLMHFYDPVDAFGDDMAVAAANFISVEVVWRKRCSV